MPKVTLAESAVSDGYSMRRYAAELALALAKHAGDGWEFERQLPPVGIQDDRHNGAVGRFYNSFQRYVRYPLAARSWHADLVHVFDHAYAQAVLGVKGAKVIVTCHDTIPWLEKMGEVPRSLPLSVILTVRWRLRLLRRANWVIAVSLNTKNDVERLVPTLKGRVSVVYSGISPALMTNVVDKVAIRRKLGFTSSDRLLLSVGATHPYKNSGSLAEAFVMISAQDPNAKWLAVGGIAEDAKRILQRSGLSDQLREIHHLNDGDLGGLYSTADALVFPSWYEGFGWPPLEAMSCGLPVVASNAGSLREVLGDAALLVEPSDVKALAMSTLSLLRDTNLRERQIAAGLAHARQFTWERTARGVLEVYKNVLDGEGV